MRDIELPGWVEPVLGSPVLAVVLLGIGVLLAAMAWRSVGNRRVLAGAGAFFTLALGINSAVLFGQRSTVRERAEETRQTMAEHVALQADEKIAGWVVPAGSVVRWKSNDHKDAEVWFAGPVQGLNLIGKWDLGEYFWSGQLGAEHAIDGWPCGAGSVYLGVDGHLQQCTTSAARTLPQVTVPAGSRIELTTDNEFSEPVDVTKVTLAEAVRVGDGVRLAEGSSLSLFRSGAPFNAETEQESIEAYGIALGSSVTWVYAGVGRGVAPPVGAQAEFVSGNLGSDLLCGRRRIAEGEGVGVARAGGGGAQVKVEVDPLSVPALLGCVAAK